MKKSFIIFSFLILITLPTILPFFNVKFFYTQDHIFIARLQQMSTALSSGQFPVRWAPDLRFGEPLFNFYAPLPYYLGAAIKLSGLEFIWVAKALFILSAVFSSFTMYIFCRKLFSQKAAILAAVLYTYAPYRAVDVYVRGALSEAWAFVFFPLIFYTSICLAQKLSLKNISFLVFSLVGLILTHNVTTLMFLPFLIFWWIYLATASRRFFVTLLGFLVAGGLASGLAAFFLLPAIFERQFIQTKYLTVGYFDFRVHFVAYKQFFSTFWGYGSSLWGPKDDMSFQIGIVNWIVVILTFLLGIIYRKDKKLLTFLLFLGGSFIFSIFIQHNKSAFIWEAIPSMAFIQFPWRFLAISVFIVSIMGAQVASFLKGRLKLGYYILILAAILSTVLYFRPKEYVDDSFFDKFLNVETMRKGVDLTKDYLPIWVATTDGERFDTPRSEKGEITVSSLKQGSTKLDFDAQVSSTSLIEVPITYFPGWQVKANNQLISQSSPSKMGLVRFELPKGNYAINIELKDTPIRTAGNTISLVSAVAILILFAFRKKYLNA